MREANVHFVPCFLPFPCISLPVFFALTDQVVVNMRGILLTWTLIIVLGEKIMKYIGHSSS